MGDAGGYQCDLAGLQFDRAVLALDGRSAGELKKDDIVVRSAGQSRLAPLHLLRRDTKRLAVPHERLRAAGMAFEQVEDADARHRPLPGAHRADEAVLVALDPDVLVGVSRSEEHTSELQSNSFIS